MKKSVIKYLNKEGYKIEYLKFDYWDCIPHAVKDDEKIPLAIHYIDNRSSVCHTLEKHNLNTFKRLFPFLMEEPEIYVKNGNVYLWDEWEPTYICKIN